MAEPFEQEDHDFTGALEEDYDPREVRAQQAYEGTVPRWWSESDDYTGEFDD